MSAAVPLIPLYSHLWFCSTCVRYVIQLAPHIVFCVYSYIYYIQCVIFEAMCSKIVSRSMNFDNPRNTVYTRIAVERHLSERWFFGWQIVLFGLTFLINLSRILHN